ncbi:hypothetical protein [Clostridium sp. 1001283B150210_160208_E6]|uniref:hypothetical protein n=1 Tax=Clostridium sp. 1001283B150210_160208_E6 TaxID=2787129 RepID=UPI0018AAB494|nr:hypothetical protein [Clostridium sp. 1001283B150210_160208_E6]
MQKENIQDLINQYKHDGFDIVDIELTNNRTIGINFNSNEIFYTEDKLLILGDGISATIDYSVIQGIVI